MDENFYSTLLENLSDGVYFVDRQRIINFWNPAAERMSGFGRSEVLDRCCADNILCHVDGLGNELCRKGCPLAATLRDGTPHESEIFLHQKNGARLPVSVRVSAIRDNSGKVIGAVEVFSDASRNTAQRQEMEALRALALTDPLTQVGNRRYGELRIQASLRDGAAVGMRTGVLLLDIDHFKRFNDTHGHSTGDEVLTLTSRTIVNLLGPIDTVARWGGEEFVIVLPNVDEATLARKAEHIRLMIEQSWLTDPAGNRLCVSVSIGATLTQTSDTLETLVDRADGLMYQSKGAGRNRVTVG